MKPTDRTPPGDYKASKEAGVCLICDEITSNGHNPDDTARGPQLEEMAYEIRIHSRFRDSLNLDFLIFLYNVTNIWNETEIFKIQRDSVT